MVTSFVCACNDGGVAPSHLCNRQCSNFFRADECDVSSIQASQHPKMGLRGNNCGRLDFNCDDINSLSVNKSLWELASTVAIGISFILRVIILLPLPFCYLCFLHLHCFKIFNGGNKRAMKVWTTDMRHEIHNFLIHSEAR